MGALLGFFGAAALAPTAILRLKALLFVVLALVMALVVVGSWALLERSGRLGLKVEVVSLQSQRDVLADSLKRCNDGVEAAAKSGTAAVGETRRLLAMAERALERNAAVRDEIRTIVRAPPPNRLDGKPKDCADALQEIRQKVRP